MSDDATTPPAPAAPRVTGAAPAPQTINVTPSVPTEYLEKLAKAEQREAALAAELKKRDATDADIKSQLAALTEKAALSEKEKGELAATRRAEKIRYEARAAAAAAGAVDPDDVAALTAAQFTLADDGRVVTTEATPRDAAAFVKDFLAKKPHLAAPVVARGSGASPFTGAAPAPKPPSSFDLKTRDGATGAMRENLLARAFPKGPPQG